MQRAGLIKIMPIIYSFVLNPAFLWRVWHQWECVGAHLQSRNDMVNGFISACFFFFFFGVSKTILAVVLLWFPVTEYLWWVDITTKLNWLRSHVSNFVASLGWEHFTPRVWWVWTFYDSLAPCTISAGQWCAVTFLMSEYSKLQGLTTSTWACCCLCCSSVCCLLSTRSWPYRHPSTVGRLGQSNK